MPSRTFLHLSFKVKTITCAIRCLSRAPYSQSSPRKHALYAAFGAKQPSDHNKWDSYDYWQSDHRQLQWRESLKLQRDAVRECMPIMVAFLRHIFSILVSLRTPLWAIYGQPRPFSSRRWLLSYKFNCRDTASSRANIIASMSTRHAQIDIQLPCFI